MINKVSSLVLGLGLCFGVVGEAHAQLQYPDPVTNIQASDGTYPTTVLVSWTAASGGAPATKYLVYRSLDNAYCPGTPVGEVNAPITQYVDTPPLTATKYYYSVRAVSAANLQSDCVDTDSGRAGGLPAPLPPENLDASDNYSDKIRVTWELPQNSQPIVSFQLFRSDTSSFCTGEPIAYVPAQALAYDDFEPEYRAEGYYYSMKSVGSSPDLLSDCTDVVVHGFLEQPKPPLPPSQVSASDGLFGDKVEVVWQHPTAGGPITNYNLYRSEDPSAPGCSSPLVTGLPASQAAFSDTNVTPGRTYYYSIGSRGPGGVSSCSKIDPGHAKIGPATISATDGDFPDKVVITWRPPAGGGDVIGYELFKSNSCTGTRLGGQVFAPGTTSYTDKSVMPGETYHYSVRVVSPNGYSNCSTDPGFAVTECSDGIDNDGDGLIDFPEDPGCDSKYDDDERSPKYVCDNGLDDDGDGKVDFRIDGTGDPGCDSPVDPSEDDMGAALKSPTFAKFNTFLGQWNFAELIN